jgi:WD40 repeat protein
LLSLERTLGDLAWRLPSSRARLEAAADDRHVWVLYDQSGRDAVSLWDVDTGCEVGGTSFATRRVSNTAVSRDGRTLALVHDDGVTVWDAYAGATIRTFEGPREPWLVLDERGARLLVWGGRNDPDERGPFLYDVGTGEGRRVNGVSVLAHGSATLSLDATTLVASGFPSQVQSWDITNEAPRALHEVQMRGWVSQCAPVSDGGVFVGTSEGEVSRWSPRDGVTRWVRDDLREHVWRLCATPDGRRVALTCIQGGGRRHDVRARRPHGGDPAELFLRLAR